MMTEENRIAALHEKMAARRRMQERRKTGVIGACSVVLSVCLLFVVLESGIGHGNQASGMYSGAMILFEGVGGYVLVAIIAFTAAVIITVLCMRRQNRK